MTPSVADIKESERETKDKSPDKKTLKRLFSPILSLFKKLFKTSKDEVQLDDDSRKIHADQIEKIFYQSEKYYKRFMLRFLSGEEIEDKTHNVYDDIFTSDLGKDKKIEFARANKNYDFQSVLEVLEDGE